MKASSSVTGVARRYLYSVTVLLVLSGMLSMQPAWAILNNDIFVNTTADDDTQNGNCTLREAVIAANTDAAVDKCNPGVAGVNNVIKFDASTNGTPISLTTVGAGEDAAATGDLDVTGGILTIQGNGVGQTIIDGYKDDRIFEVLNSGTSLTLENLTVTNGTDVPQGGGIWSHTGTSLTLNSVVVSNNVATNSSTAAGGGIEADGAFSMSLSWVTGNIAQSTGTGTVFGGGLYLTASNAVSISQSAIANNTAWASSGSADGGGVETNSPLTVTKSIVTGNKAQSDSGQAYGGGIDVGNGALDLQRVELSNNTAQGPSGSQSAFGGGLATSYQTTLTNATIAGNQALVGRGGGVYFSGPSALLDAHGATIARNTATDGGGIDVEGGASFQLTNTLLVDNTLSPSTGTGPDCDDWGGAGIVTSANFNLVGIADGCTTLHANTSDQVGSASAPVDPMLDTLQAIGGNGTRVLPLLPGSPAIDTGDAQTTASGGTCVSPDQVGITRPKDDNGDGTAACDIGAVEYVKRPTTSGGGGGGGALGYLGLFALLAAAFAATTMRGRRTVV